MLWFLCLLLVFSLVNAELAFTRFYQYNTHLTRHTLWKPSLPFFKLSTADKRRHRVHFSLISPSIINSPFEQTHYAKHGDSQSVQIETVGEGIFIILEARTSDCLIPHNLPEETKSRESTSNIAEDGNSKGQQMIFKVSLKANDRIIAIIPISDKAPVFGRDELLQSFHLDPNEDFELALTQFCAQYGTRVALVAAELAPTHYANNVSVFKTIANRKRHGQYTILETRIDRTFDLLDTNVNDQ